MKCFTKGIQKPVHRFLAACLIIEIILSGSACSDVGNPPPEGKYPEPFPLMDIKMEGELSTRLRKNFNRMEEKKYHPEHVFLSNEESHWWPGDTEGRTVLALTLLAQSAHRNPLYLESILDKFPDHMNKRGYFGDIPPEGVLDEQQLSSHGWVLRGLCEYYEWKQDEQVLSMIESIVENLVIPTKGMHRDYPTHLSDREEGKGSYIGSRAYKMLNNWILSTDVGCDFVFLDGVVHAFQVTGDMRLKDIIEEMTEVYLSIDPIGIKVQTHAMLTGLRGLLRYYEITGNPELIAAVEERFALYKTHAITENYENYNWFGGPSHTEPCGIHDSYMVAVQLWKYTGKPVYLEDAHHIYYNAIAATQRSNGGFGCNSCSGAHNHALGMKIFEAHWCCTMRGGEGLTRAAEYSWFINGNVVFVPFFREGSAELHDRDGILSVKQTTEYPFGNTATFEIRKNTLPYSTKLKLFAPSFLTNYTVSLNGQSLPAQMENGFIIIDKGLREGDSLVVGFDMRTVFHPAINQHTIGTYGTLRYGPLILSSVEKTVEKPYILPDTDLEIEYLKGGLFKVNEVLFSTVYHLLDPEMDDMDIARQILFEVSD